MKREEIYYQMEALPMRTSSYRTKNYSVASMNQKATLFIVFRKTKNIEWRE
jgi:hypothetical protein